MSGAALKPGAWTPSMSKYALAPFAYISFRKTVSEIARSLCSVVGESPALTMTAFGSIFLISV